MKAIIYARYSAGRDQTVQSIEGQVRVCRKYIEDHGWALSEIYSDEHISGKTDRRPAFQRMISDAEGHKFDVLVVYTSDRFSRDRYNSIIYKKKLRDLGVKIAYAAENIPEGPEGVLMESMMEAWAHYYSDELSRKVKRGMIESAQKCKSNGGRRTFGYRVGSDKLFSVDKDEAWAVEQVFEKAAAGESIKEIAAWLNSHGYKPTLGVQFRDSSLRRMLANRRYLGEYRFDDVVIEDGLPRIISDDLFKAVQERFERNRRIMAKDPIKYALTGRATCGVCGGPLTGCAGTGKSGKTYYYYRCKSKCISNVAKENLEALVLDHTVDFFSDPAELDHISEMLYYYLAQKNSLEAKIRIPKKRKNALEKQKSNLVQLIAETGNKSLVERLNEIEAELEALEEELRPAWPELTKEQLALSFKTLILNGQSDQRIIDALIKEVIVNNDHLLIVFNIQADKPEGERKKIEVFAQGDKWWSDRNAGRTPALVDGCFSLKINRG